MTYFCRDCNKEIIVNPDTEDLVGGKCLKYKSGDEEYYIIKCDQCFKKDPSLRNYRKTEVYSRVVGYIRPVQQWNKGKQEEYKDRKVFTNK